VWWPRAGDADRESLPRSGMRRAGTPYPAWGLRSRNGLARWCGGLSRSFLVVGLGNVGLRALWDLYTRGYKVLGVDSSYEAVERARRLGLPAELGDYAAVGKIVESRGLDVDAVLVDLPGSIGYDAVKTIISAGFNVVDVSFYREDPWELAGYASKQGVVLVVDAGIAPGLSNFLVGAGVRRIGARKAYIYVGGISKRRDANPLGLAAAWSVEDLIDEYLRPAKYIVRGKVKVVDPLSVEPGRFEVPGLGELEYFYTDGLRTLLKSFPMMEYMAEYTLRWPGHLELMKKLARLGLLDEKNLNIDGCPVTPRKCFAAILKDSLSGVEDLVVLVVILESSKGTLRFRVVVEPDENWSAMAKATASFQASVAELVAEADLPRGLVVPEKLGLDKDYAREIMARIEKRGIHVIEY